MSGAYIAHAIRFVQHLLAAALGYLVFCGVFFWDQLPYPRWNMFWYLSMTYASIVIVPAVSSLKKRILLIFLVFGVAGALLVVADTSRKYIDWELAIFSGLFAALNPGALCLVASYALFIFSTKKLFRKGV